MSASLLPGFVITFREGLEAALVVAIVASYLKRTGHQNLNRYLYSGAAAAVGASVLVGMSVSAVYGELTGVSEGIFDGVASLTATVVLTYMILWMMRHAQTMRAELERKLEMTITAGQMLGIVALSFVAVFREGFETVLFLTTLAIIDSSGTLTGAAAGSIAVIAIGALLMRGIYRLDLNKLFRVTSIILIFFAAGLAGYGVHELIEAGESSGIQLGVLGREAFDINPPRNPDGAYPLLHEKGAVGSVLAALFGYSGNPEWLRVIVYSGYWLVVGTYILMTHRKMTRS
jgi:high-affinity iron transporter